MWLALGDAVLGSGWFVISLRASRLPAGRTI